jgi:rhodanese-related sulfurtransferase
MTHTGTSTFHYITKDEIKDLMNKGANYTLIDVRTPAEAASAKPLLPTAKNIPIDEFDNAFQLSDEDFLHKYNFPKPETKQQVIVYCQAGMRAGRAAKMLVEKTYEK